MSVTRRQFLLGTAAGLVLPSFYERVHSFFENHGEPLLVPPSNTGEILHAHSPLGEGFELHLGEPYLEPPTMSIREFCLAFGDGNPEAWWRENWLFEDDTIPINMDEPMDPHAVWDWWMLKYSSNARAYHYLEALDLGPKLSGADAVGGLAFHCGYAPGVDYLGAEAVDEVSLSLLQQRLNELGSGIEVKLY